MIQIPSKETNTDSLDDFKLPGDDNIKDEDRDYSEYVKNEHDRNLDTGTQFDH